jgi:hypothetical protein
MMLFAARQSSDPAKDQDIGPVLFQSHTLVRTERNLRAEADHRALAGNDPLPDYDHKLGFPQIWEPRKIGGLTLMSQSDITYSVNHRFQLQTPDQRSEGPERDFLQRSIVLRLSAHPVGLLIADETSYFSRYFVVGT